MTAELKAPRTAAATCRRHGYWPIFASSVSANFLKLRPTSRRMSIQSGLSRAVPHSFNDVKYFRASATSPFEAASRPAPATADANCLNEASCAVSSLDFAWRSASESALNWFSLRLNAEPAANNGRALQSAARKLLTAAAFSPCCQAVSAGCETGDDDDAASACAVGGVAELPDELFFLPQPAIKIVAAITPVMIAFFIKCNAANHAERMRRCVSPSTSRSAVE